SWRAVPLTTLLPIGAFVGLIMGVAAHRVAHASALAARPQRSALIRWVALAACCIGPILLASISRQSVAFVWDQGANIVAERRYWFLWADLLFGPGTWVPTLLS